MGKGDVLNINPGIPHVYNSNKGEALVSVGDRLQIHGKFIPELYSSKWDNEVYLSFILRNVNITNEVETFSNNTVSIKAQGITHRFYELNTTEYEYELILDEAPSANRLVFTLDFPNGLDFFYQDVLTSDEISKGYNRPERVIGSYAVYWNKKNKKYKTGKFCHIYRPELIDAVGTRRWANIDINGKTATITGDFSGLVFPVIVDPTIGYSTAGASSYNSNRLFAGYGTTDSSGGNVDSYHCAIASVPNPTGIRFGVCLGDTNGNPSGQNLIEQVLGVNSQSDDVAVDSVSASTLLGNTVYSILAMPNDGFAAMKFDSVPGEHAYYNDTDVNISNPIPSVIPTMNDAAGYRYSIWLDYTSGSVSFEYIGNAILNIISSSLSSETNNYSYQGSSLLQLESTSINQEVNTYSYQGNAVLNIISNALSQETNNYGYEGKSLLDLIVNSTYSKVLSEYEYNGSVILNILSRGVYSKVTDESIIDLCNITLSNRKPGIVLEGKTPDVSISSRKPSIVIGGRL